MGLDVLKIEVRNPGNHYITESVEFLVDSGAVYSVVPKSILEKLGIKPLGKEEFQLANGEVIIRQRGIALFRYQGKIGLSGVIFGETGDNNLLGAFTLESLGFFLEPLKRELKTLPHIPERYKTQ